MKKIKNFESFNEGLERITSYINRILKRGGDFAGDVWDATKRESQETRIAVEILGRMIKGEDVSDKEKEFVKRQSGDLVRILPLVAISGLPIPIPITPLLIMLGKKYGFDLLPKDHRAILNDDVEVELNRVELTKDLQDIIKDHPEKGMGYHIVDLVLKNGRVMNNRKVLNSSILILNPDETLNVDDIDDIIID
jgi:hypothetical protein